VRRIPGKKKLASLYLGLYQDPEVLRQFIEHYEVRIQKTEQRLEIWRSILQQAREDLKRAESIQQQLEKHGVNQQTTDS
jgi:flagellar biosynthesis chaperone FliJ